MDEKERRRRLEDWLEFVKGDVQDLLLDEYLFWQLQEVVSNNPSFAKASGLFTQWMASSFIQTTAVGVRRQAKAGADSVSLKRFPHEVRDYPALVSRGHYMGLYDGIPEWLGEIGKRHFDRLAGEGSDHLAQALIDKQLADLDNTVVAIEHYVDRRIAHYDQRGLARPTPTLDDLSDALKTLERLVLFYWVLLRGASMTTLLPTIQCDWMDIFTFAWVPRNEESSENVKSTGSV
jgi:hypothetical protein